MLFKLLELLKLPESSKFLKQTSELQELLEKKKKKKLEIIGVDGKNRVLKRDWLNLQVTWQAKEWETSVSR